MELFQSLVSILRPHGHHLKRGQFRNRFFFSNPEHFIINFTSSQEIQFSWEQVSKLGMIVAEQKYPLNQIFWCKFISYEVSQPPPTTSLFRSKCRHDKIPLASQYACLLFPLDSRLCRRLFPRALRLRTIVGQSTVFFYLNKIPLI
jgi:hypothetical protein